MFQKGMPETFSGFLTNFVTFSWKWKEERQDENDSFPRSCTICGKTTRGVPSVACDFCPSVYHLDCLDPPLCEVPTVSSVFINTVTET